MKLNAKVLKGLEITAATIPANGQYPERKGWKLDGYWLNGSEQYESAADLIAGLEGEEISPSKSGKSLVIVGSFTAPKSENLVKILTARGPEATITMADLNDLI